MRPRQRTLPSGSTSPRNASTSATRHARLRVLAGHVDLEQAVDRLARARPRAGRTALSESTAWIRRTRPTRSRTLRLWTWPMKSQVKTSPYRSCLARSASVRFSPTSVTPPSPERRQVVRLDVLRRGQDLDVRARPRARTRARFAAMTAGSSTEHPDHPLAAGRPPVAPVREVPLAGRRSCTRPRPRRRRRRRLRAPAAAHSHRSARPSRTTSSPKRPLEHVADVVAHLVAARPRARPDRRGRPAAHRLDARARRSRPRAPASRREARPGGAPSARAIATGRQSAVSSTSGRPRRLVARPSDFGNGSTPGSRNLPGAGSLVHLAHVRAVHLPRHRRRRRSPPAAVDRPAPVLGDVRGVVGGERAQVERAERAARRRPRPAT